MQKLMQQVQGPHSRLLRPGSASEIDATDMEIIRLLQRDGRLAFKDIAERLKIVEKTVRKRVAELRASSFIEITVVSNPGAIGYSSLALIGVRIGPGRTRTEIARQVFEVSAVDYVVTTLGPFDLLVEVVCRDDLELGRTIDESIRSIDGISGIEIFPYFELHYQQPAWDRASKKDNDRATERQARLDVVDQGIIRFLSEDGRTPLLEIARQLGVSEGQIRKRFARLTEDGTIQVLAITNPRSIGYDVAAWVCITIESGSSMRQVADKLVTIPSVAYLATCAGRFDIMTEVVCRNRADLYTLVDGTLRAMPGVASAQTLICDEFLYRRLIPIESVSG